MIFDALNISSTTEDRIIQELHSIPPTFKLDFGNPEAVAEVQNMAPLMKIDEDGDEDITFDELSPEEIAKCYNEDEFEGVKESEKSKKFYSAPSIFKDASLEQKETPLKRFYNDIIGDVNEFVKYLGVKPHWQQQQLLDAYQRGDTHIATRSGQGPGKTFISTVIWLHWLMANRYGLLVVTAPTMRQCKDVWLAQARQLIAEADPRIKVAYEFTNTGIKMFGHKASDWGAYLATASRAENFQGIHRERLGIHCEEASGLDRSILETIQGTLSNAAGTFLWMQIGNPNSRDCAFYDCFYSPKSIWTKLHWNGEETPETSFFSQRRNKEVADEHGINSDVYRVRVKGEFPNIDPSAMMSLEDLMKCTTPQAKSRAKLANARMKRLGKMRRHIGIDVARMGGDENCVVPWDGNIMKEIQCYPPRTDPNDAVDHAVFLQSTYEWSNKETLYIIDTSGMGEGIVGRVGQEKRMGRKVHEFYSQNSSTDSMKYANKISEAWMLFRKAVMSGEIYLVYDKKMFQQLTSRRYGIDKRGRILIEAKDDYKKRHAKGSDTGILGKSPDRADATIMGYFPVAEESVRINAVA